MAGHFVRVSTTANLGLDIAQMQAVLSTGYSVIADVDAGICVNTRRSFMDAVTIVKKALQPNPQVVLVLGDNENAGLHVFSGERRHFGIDKEDLLVLRDAVLKQKLQAAQECLEMLTCGSLQASVEALAKMDKPPHLTYVLVMEAIAVLFTPLQTFQSPSKNMAAAAWVTVKKCTASYESFRERLLSVDKYNIPPRNLIVLEEYAEHVLWPKRHQLLKVSRGDWNSPYLRANVSLVMMMMMMMMMVVVVGGGGGFVMVSRTPINCCGIL